MMTRRMWNTGSPSRNEVRFASAAPDHVECCKVTQRPVTWRGPGILGPGMQLA